jgi:hypothetical protein
MIAMIEELCSFITTELQFEPGNRKVEASESLSTPIDPGLLIMIHEGASPSPQWQRL